MAWQKGFSLRVADRCSVKIPPRHSDSACSDSERTLELGEEHDPNGGSSVFSIFQLLENITLRKHRGKVSQVRAW